MSLLQWLSILLAGSILLAVILISWLNHKESRFREELRQSLHVEQTTPFTSLQQEIKGLPEPVQRYFTMALGEAEELPSSVVLTQQGKLWMKPDSDKALSFTATQHITSSPVGFLWNARVSVAPLIHVRVVDSYIDGIGASAVQLLSTFRLGLTEDNPHHNRGSLFRYLAEGVWCPVTLLPSRGVRWEAVDDTHAWATIEDNGLSASILMTFNEKGEIIKIHTEERYGLFGDQYLNYPWEGHFSHYETHQGIRIPSRGEVGWHLPEGFWLFFKGTIQHAQFNGTH